MRRSEMIKILYQAVDKSITETTSANLVDVILTAAENAGMLPPVTYPDDPVEACYMWDEENEEEA